MAKMKPIMLVMALLMLISIIYAVQGIMMHAKVAGEEAEFHQLQREYWGMDKATRDAAPAGSALNQQLAEIQNTPSELLRLKLVGVGKLLTGIYVLLFGILIALIMMPKRFGTVLKGQAAASKMAKGRKKR